MDVRWFFVDTNTEAFKFRFDDTLVCEWLVDVENNEDQVTRFGHRNNLPTTAFTILGSLDDTWQI